MRQLTLIKNNLVPLSFIDVSESVHIDGLIGVYEHTRVELLRDDDVLRVVHELKTVLT